MGRNWVVGIFLSIMCCKLCSSQIDIISFEQEVSVDSVMLKLDNLYELEKYLIKVDQFVVSNNLKNTYHYSTYLFSVGLALNANKKDPSSYFEQSLKILEGSKLDYWDEKSLGHYYLAKSNLIHRDNIDHYKKNIFKSYNLLPNVSNVFPLTEREFIKYSYLKLLMSDKKYNQAISILKTIDDDKLYDIQKDDLLFIEAELYESILNADEELKSRKIIFNYQALYQENDDKYNYSTIRYLELLLQNKEFDLIKKIFKRESKHINTYKSSSKKFNLYSSIIDENSLIKLSSNEITELEESLNMDFNDLEYLMFTKNKNSVNYLLDKNLINKAIHKNSSHLIWQQTKGENTVLLVMILLLNDEIYKRSKIHKKNRIINFKQIIDLLENDPLLFNLIGIEGYKIPVISNKLGYNMLYNKYCEIYLENQLSYFEAAVRSGSSVREGAIIFLSHTIDEILLLNSKNFSKIDLQLIRWIELFNQYKLNGTIRISDIRKIKLPEMSLSNRSFTSNIILFRQIFNKEKNCFEVVSYALGLENDEYFLIKKSIHSLTYFLEHVKQNPFFLLDLFDNWKTTARIFIISSGFTSFINFFAVIQDIEKRTNNKVDIINSSCLKDTQAYSSAKIKSDWEIHIFGDIEYNGKFNKQKLISRNISSANDWTYLPGTRTETDLIAKIAKKNHLEFNLYSDEAASMAALEKITKSKVPYILHIASHGFFLRKNPDSSLTYQKYLWKAEDIMNRSGIVLSSGNDYWTSNTNVPAKTDGILTSNEIADMDFKNCKLIVLSSCRSGFGGFSNANELLSFQRAFSLAGVDNVIVSLSDIIDDKAPIFFKYFYSQLFKDLTIHEAFSNTQIEMMKRYGLEDDFWTSFILLEYANS
jgi:hypothetical protein